VPACPSSPIDLLAARIGSTPDRVADTGMPEPAGTQAPADLVAALAQVPDPRSRRGIRHRRVTVLALAVCAVLAGARSYVAIAEWAHDLPLGVRIRLGLTVGRATPSESTIRRILGKVDPEALDQLVSAWLVARAARTSPPTPDPPQNSAPDNSARRNTGALGTAVGSGPGSVAATPPRQPSPRVIAVDGKSARGARRAADGRAVHLLAAFEVRSGIVLGQSVVDGKSNEITAFTPLLDRIDITDTIITADALHTQDEHARYLHQRGAHFVFVVKGNRPKLHQQLTGLPWQDIPAVDITQDAAHGRRETRTLKLAEARNAATGGLLFPHAQLAIQIVRRRRPATSTPGHTETVYAVTDLSWQQIRADQLAEAIREHWHVENKLHWIRDVTFAEDLSQIRTGHGPANMAALRNLALSRHRIAGATNIAAACRHTSRHPNRVLPLLT
jgi:predicted transposase YbfD/YdcC